MKTSERVIKANKDCLIYYLDKNNWLEKVLRDNKIYNKFIDEMAVEIKTYQEFKYKQGYYDGKRSKERTENENS